LSDADREARIEQLLLSGLDQYFTGNYEGAINIWTRVAFLERGHGRARAYIERARSALAEQQRESEELLHTGVAAYNAGDLEAARDLLTRSVAQGGASDTALVFLQRLSHLEGAADAAPDDLKVLPRHDRVPAVPSPRSRWIVTLLVSAGIAAGILTATRPLASWLSELPVSTPAVHAVVPEPLPIVRASDLLVSRAHDVGDAGRLRDALRLLERIDIADPRRGDADRLRADFERMLLAAARADQAKRGQRAEQGGRPTGVGDGIP
jgi:hypothetical protein